MFEVGDLVKGLPDAPYGITNEKMLVGVVKEVDENNIRVKVLKHENGEYGTYFVNAKYFEKIGHVKQFNRTEVIERIKTEGAQVLSEYDLRRADLRRANLSGADLSDADLSGADLSGADLSDADLRRADLSDADLRRADLSDADLSDADLRRADLSDADLRRADLSGADLSDADLSGADLSGADLSQTQGLIDAINYMEAHFERTEEGYIAYKTFNSQYTAPDKWKIEPGEVLEEVCNPERTCDCGCGINVAPLGWVKARHSGQIYKMLIRFEWLAGVVVPYQTDGKIRCSRAQILEVVE